MTAGPRAQHAENPHVGDTGSEHQPEREGVVVPARLAAPHQVGALLAQSQQALCLRAAQGSVIPPTRGAKPGQQRGGVSLWDH